MWASRCLLDNNRSIKIVYDSYLLVNNWLGSGSSVIFCTGDTKTDTDIHQPLKSGSMCVAINLEQLKIPCSAEIDGHRFGYLALPSKTRAILSPSFIAAAEFCGFAGFTLGSIPGITSERKAIIP